MAGVTDKFKDAANKASEGAKQAADKAQDKAKEAADAGRDKAKEAADSAGQAVARVGEKIRKQSG